MKKRGISNFDFDNERHLLPKSKLSQTTIFILLSILILSVAGIYYLAKQEQINKRSDQFFNKAEIKPTVENIQKNVFDCIKITSEDALIFTGLQGGLYFVPENENDYEGFDFFFMPYYYNQGKVLIPSKKKIEGEISEYINDELELCLKNISFEGFDINTGKIKSEVEINKREIEFTVKSSILVIKDGYLMQINLKKYPYERESKLYDIYEVANYITISHKENDRIFCISCLSQLAKEKNVFIGLDDYGENIGRVTIFNDQTRDYFQFLNKYKDTNIEIIPPV